ncbi:hypothetical protein NC653_015907 [Populus alba x Populus x berolinensis]|uniref:Uncharacterized protein n=1 Tax=Populus alba x Populus x berolinensis TaxID=444605 RepID=A0AAD6QLP7_9ROSI|nr:hypothetical protein NC653_015907 [Populus alba x Populus x berolinensis]
MHEGPGRHFGGAKLSKSMNLSRSIFRRHCDY